jgi:hypothetical protein
MKKQEIVIAIQRSVEQQYFLIKLEKIPPQRGCAWSNVKYDIHQIKVI